MQNIVESYSEVHFGYHAAFTALTLFNGDRMIVFPDIFKNDGLRINIIMATRKKFIFSFIERKLVFGDSFTRPV